MSLLRSKNTTWNFTEVLGQLKFGMSLHSMTSSRFGKVPVTPHHTFCAVPGRAARSSQKGATSVDTLEMGIVVLSQGGEGKEPVKLTVPLSFTHKSVKFPPPNRIGNGGVIWATWSSDKLRLVPVIVL